MRLTFKGKNPFNGEEQYYPYLVRNDEIHFEKQTECNNKLGQLEDIEEELGIDLITLFKALVNGIYARSEENFSKIDFYDSVRLGIYNGRFVFCGFDSAERLWIMVCVADKDRWALTKEELQ